MVDVQRFISHGTGFAKWNYTKSIMLDEAFQDTPNWHAWPRRTLGEVAEAESLRAAFFAELKDVRLVNETPEPSKRQPAPRCRAELNVPFLGAVA